MILWFLNIRHSGTLFVVPHLCHTPVLKSRTEASTRVPRMFNHTHSNNMINR
jgi:hypothetical protein